MFSKKVAIVTGANKGLGFAIVKKLCEKDYGIVYLTSRDTALGEEAKLRLEEDGLTPKYHQLDVTKRESIKTFCKYIQETHGKVNLLINNAGVLFSKGSKEPFSYQVVKTLEVNYFSLVNLTEALLPLLTEGSKVINISSSSGHLSRIPSVAIKEKLKSPDMSLEELNNLMKSYIDDPRIEEWGDKAYVVSKVSVNAYTFILHRRLSPKGITVNCVHPGYIQTDMTCGAGTKSPEDGAEVPLKLALDDCGSGNYFWHNGVIVQWDGDDPRGFIDGMTV